MTRRFVAFVRLSRLKFLVGGFAGGALGTAIAAFERGSFGLGTFVLAQTAITGAHLMTQYANDYFDRASDARTERTPYSGGSGMLVDGSLDPSVALVASLCCLAVSAGAAVALFARGHAVAAALGTVILVLAWAYSAPPLRLLARGLGELDTALVVAMLVPLCAYAAQTGTVDARALASTLPGAAAMFVMMVCVQVPDLAADAATGKRNLVVRLGSRRAARLAFAALALIAASLAVARILGAPLAFVLFEAAAVVPVVRLLGPLEAFGRGRPGPPAALAGRGVALFATVAIAGAIGYAVAARDSCSTGSAPCASSATSFHAFHAANRRAVATSVRWPHGWAVDSSV